LKSTLLRILQDHAAELHTLLARLTLRADVADDLFQDLFLKLNGSNNMELLSNPMAYVRRMAMNLAFDWRRANKRAVAAMAARPELKTAELPPWLRLTNAEEADRILAAVSELSPMMREAFVLRFVRQEGYAQVGAALGRTAHQARGLCHAAVQEIRQRLSENTAHQLHLIRTSGGAL
jgi:RNA polymerase sigma-70 factor (ECF subfamily)